MGALRCIVPLILVVIVTYFFFDSKTVTEGFDHVTDAIKYPGVKLTRASLTQMSRPPAAYRNNDLFAHGGCRPVTIRRGRNREKACDCPGLGIKNPLFLGHGGKCSPSDSIVA